MKHRVMQLTTAIALALAAGTAAAGGTGDVTRATLDNGLRVVIVRDTLAPVVTTEMNYLVGSDEVPAGFPGTAHAIEHMMFRGSPGLSKDQLAAIAANMGGAFNADTTQGVTQYYFVAPSQDLDVALHVQSLRMRGVDMTRAPLGEGARRDRAGGVARPVQSRPTSSTSSCRRSCSTARLTRTRPLGTRAFVRQDHGGDAQAVPRQLVCAEQRDPGDCRRCRSGGHAGTVQVANSAISRARRCRRGRRSSSGRCRRRRSALPTDSPYGSVYLAYRMPGLRSRRITPRRWCWAGAGVQARGAVRHGHGWHGAVRRLSAPSSCRRPGFGMAVGIFPRGGNPKPVLAKMRAILAEAASKGVDPALVEAAKRKAIAGLEFQKNSVDGLANAWSQALAFQGLDSPDAMKQAIEAVTPAQVDALAKATVRSGACGDRDAHPGKLGQAGGRQGLRRCRELRLQPGQAGAVAGLGGAGVRQAGGAAFHPQAGRLHLAQRPAPDRAAGVDQRHGAGLRQDEDQPGPAGGRRARRAWPTCSTGCSRSARTHLESAAVAGGAGRHQRQESPVRTFRWRCRRRILPKASSCWPTTNCTRRCRHRRSPWCSTSWRASWPDSCSRLISSPSSAWTRPCCRRAIRSCVTPRRNERDGADAGQGEAATTPRPSAPT